MIAHYVEAVKFIPHTHIPLLCRHENIIKIGIVNCMYVNFGS